jgi:tRNA A64-2'-O-ribosylphosphate transferase
MQQCHFKSADGHIHHWQFNLRRLNLNLLRCLGKHGVALIADSTRKGKAFPDSFSRTLPIWCAVINRVLASFRTSSSIDKHDRKERIASADCGRELHMPHWVTEMEQSQLQPLITKWVQQCIDVAEIDWKSLASVVTKPLRCLWISPATNIDNIATMVRELSQKFVVCVCVSVSQLEAERVQQRSGWFYVQGAGDDEEFWSKGLTPQLFWQHSSEFAACKTDDECCELTATVLAASADTQNASIETHELDDTGIILAFSDTAVHSVAQSAASSMHADAVIVCVDKPIPVDSLVQSTEELESKLRLQADAIPTLRIHASADRRHRWSFLQALPKALEFYRDSVASTHSRRVLIMSSPNHSIAAAIAMAILVRFFSHDYQPATVSVAEIRAMKKAGVRKRLLFIQQHASQVQPARSILQQLNMFFLSNSSPTGDIVT